MFEARQSFTAVCDGGLWRIASPDETVSFGGLAHGDVTAFGVERGDRYYATNAVVIGLPEMFDPVEG